MTPSPTKRRKFDHITNEIPKRRPMPVSANRRSNSLSSSIVYAINACDSGVESGACGTLSAA